MTPWTVARQAPLSVEFSRQEYWSGLPCVSPGDLPNPGIELQSPILQTDFHALIFYRYIMKYLGFPGSLAGKESACNAGDPCLIPRSGTSWTSPIPWRRDRLPTPVFLGFLDGSDGKESACNAEDLGSIPRLGRSPGGGHGNPLQYSCLENPHGQRSLVNCSTWSPKESDTTE